MRRFIVILFAFLFSFNSEAQFIINPYQYAADALMLDSYSVAVSYDLRKTRTAYTGNCIRVRRSGDNAEQNIGFVNNNLDTTALMSFTGTNSAYVTTWYDQSGNNFNVTQSTLTKQPRIVNAGVLETKNSKPAIKFDGTDDILLNASHPTAIQDGNNYSAFWVSSHETSGGFARVVSSIKNSAPTGQWTGYLNRAGQTNFQISNSSATLYNSIAPTVLNSSDYRLVSAFTTGNTFKSFRNDIAGDTVTYVSPYTLDNFGIGGRSDESGQFVLGHIGAVIILSGDESANRTTIENNINTFYSIY